MRLASDCSELKDESIHLFICLSILSSIYSLGQPTPASIHFFIQSNKSIHSSIHPLTKSFIQPLIHPSTINPSTHTLTHPSIHSSIHHLTSRPNKTTTHPSNIQPSKPPLHPSISSSNHTKPPTHPSTDTPPHPFLPLSIHPSDPINHRPTNSSICLSNSIKVLDSGLRANSPTTVLQYTTREHCTPSVQRQIA